jgi:preprotein translocase subunit SecD
LDTGFSDAMAVILDSNITTFLAGVVLYKFGTGPIQGFAITLMLGIIATLLSGLFFLRATFEVVLNSKKDGRISI